MNHRMNLLKEYYEYLWLTTFHSFHINRRPKSNVHVRLRAALLSECDLVAYRSVEPLVEDNLWPVSRRGPTLHIDSGEWIKEIEWKDEWPNGERYFQSI
jgi:hypothetical protein